MTEEYLVARTCTEIAEREGGEEISCPLHEFRRCPAYVLLGESGAGKSKAFEMEAKVFDDSVPVSARDFVTFSRDEWRGKTLFIDGLDEMRAGSAQGGAALDAIRKRLDELGRPRFRLSCRAADWYGATDQQGLKQVSPNGEVAVLQLDPLTHADMQAILVDRQGENEATAFMARAEALGMQEWLTNPQTLNMLIEAVTEQQQWPDSRQNTYELACKRMVREPNEAHRDATRVAQPYSDETLLDAAGCLCTVLLLADLAGFALDEDAAADGFASLSQLTPLDRALPMAAALRSRLFKPSGIERCVPVHRSAAEYLAARWLASRINQQGLPLGRALALMTGIDGGVVTGLRGLYAWLAVFGIAWRDQLIERDALGLVLYGDIKEFPREDKRRLLDALHREAEQHIWLNYRYHDSLRFGAMATADMEKVFREILNLSKPDRAWQGVMVCMMDALQYGESLPGLADDLLKIVRDGYYWPALRKGALRAYMYVNASMTDVAARLLQLMDAIRDGAVEDGDDELLGILLSYLYPTHLPPSHLLEYLHPPKQQSLIGAYHWFWAHEVHEKTPESSVPELLDQWVARNISDQKWEYRNTLDGIKGKFLVRGIQSVGDKIDTRRLYDWLGIGIDRRGYSEHLEREDAKIIAVWLGEHPEHYKAIILYGSEQCFKVENFRTCLYQVGMRLYSAPPPNGMVEWYLQQAEAASQDDWAREFFDRAIRALGTHSKTHPFGLKALEFLESWVTTRPRFLPWLNEYLSCPLNDWHAEDAQYKRERDREREQNKNAWLQYFRQHQSAIRDGSAHPKVLADLASAYFGHFYEAAGETQAERLDNFLDHDATLVADALSGFRHALNRNDLPSIEEIVASGLKGSMYYLCWPCQAGMELSTPEEIAALDDDRLGRIVAFQQLYSAHNDSAWESMLRHTRPDLMADVLVRCAIPYLRTGKEHVEGLYGLAYSAESAEIARIATLPLLQGFPVRSKKAQLSNLRYLLVAGLRYLDRPALLNVVSTKLENRLDDPQRIYWLAAGTVEDPATYAQPLMKFVGNSQKKAEYVAGFFSERYEQYSLTGDLPETCVAWLIQLLGKSYRPYVLKGAGLVSHAMNMADLVQSWIRYLGGIAGTAAGDELAYLLAQPGLSAWHDEIRIALRGQSVIQRDHLFQHPPLERVCRTLSNLQPANPADLAALMLDHLLALREKIRHGSTNDYHQYWSFDDSNKALTTPKPENECRDALLSDLQECLGKLGVEAIKEGYYAEDKRADIRVSFCGAKGFNVPIEIKKDSHRDLWTAIRKQLIGQYTQDPATGGYGIYLVFWFGGKGIPLSGGKRPSNASELEEHLRSSLTDDERKYISIIVMDCSIPA